MFDPAEFSRIQVEAAQEVREAAFEARQQSHGVERPRSKAEEFAEGWDEMDTVAKGWPDLSGSGAGKPVWKSRRY